MENNLNINTVTKKTEKYSNKKNGVNANLLNEEGETNFQKNIKYSASKSINSLNNNLFNTLSISDLNKARANSIFSVSLKSELAKLNFLMHSHIITNKDEHNQDLNHIDSDKINTLVTRIANFEKFIKDIKSQMAKCKYRKALEDIIMREDLFYDMENFWRIRDLKIRCMLKILEKKIFKSDASATQKLKSIELWTFKIEAEIETWIGYLNFLKTTDNNDCYEEQIETLVNVILEELNLQAQYKHSIKQIPETTAILGLAERMIKIFGEFSRSVKVIQSCQKIFLFISSFLISDNDFLTAKKYQIATIRFAFKELFLRSDMEDGINYETLSKTNQHYMNKIFLNIIKTYYHRGVCDENLGNLPEAIESYKQAVWFANNFIKYQYPEISQFLVDVDQRAKQYHKLIRKLLERYDSSDFLEKNNKNKGKSKFNLDNEQSLLKSPFSKNTSEKKKKTKNSFFNPNNEQEFLDFVGSIKHQEFEFLEDCNKSERIKQIMSTLNLLNNFSSDKFRDIVKLLPNITIEKMDKIQAEKIQKRLNDIRAEKNFSELQKRRADMKNKNRIIESNNLKAELEQYLLKDPKSEAVGNIINLNNINFEKNYKISVNMFLNTEKFLGDRNTEATSPQSINKNSKNALTISSNNNNNNNNQNYVNSNSNEENKNNGFSERNFNDNRPNTQNKVRPHSYKVGRNPAAKIEKYSHNDYVFSTDFQRKMKTINEFVKKETDFQKKLLHLKKYERLPMEICNIDHIAIKEEAKNYFERAKSANKSGFIFSNEKQAKKTNTLKDIEKEKKEKYKQKLEVSLIKSLDTKILSILERFRKIEEKSENLIREEFLNKGNPIANDKADIEKINNDIIKKIDKELSFLNKKEHMCKKIIFQDNLKIKMHLREKSRQKLLLLNNKDNSIENTHSFIRPMTAKNPWTHRNYETLDYRFSNNLLIKKEKYNNLKNNIDVDLFIHHEKFPNSNEQSNYPSPVRGRNGEGNNKLMSTINSFNNNNIY